MAVDAIILNRNLREVTDRLAESLEVFEGMNSVHVVDAGSKDSEISQRTFVQDASSEARRNGLRLNRGFNLGLSAWVESSPTSEWVFLLPNDSIVTSADFVELEEVLSRVQEVVAVIPVSESNSYEPLIGSDRLALAWNFHEGPILLRRDYVANRIKSGYSVFDGENFRGFASFLELSFQIYLSNFAAAVTNFVTLQEDNKYLLTLHELIGTEPYSENLKLLFGEGRDWLQKKYGASDRRALELASRLLFEEFRRVNPHVKVKPAV